MPLLVRFLGTVFALLLATRLIPGFVVEDLLASVIVAVLLGFVNITLKPIVLFLTLPINVLTLGLFTLVVNALFLMLLALFIPGFTVVGFLPALLGGLLIAVTLWLLDLFF